MRTFFERMFGMSARANAREFREETANVDCEKSSTSACKRWQVDGELKSSAPTLDENSP